MPLKYLIFILLGLIFLSYFIFLAFYLIEPKSAPQNVFVSNLTDAQATVSYTTKIPIRSYILVSKNGKFPLLPIFTKPILDDGEKNLGKNGFYATHHITISNLDPQITYKFRIYQKLKAIYEGEFKTASISESPASPSPVYGKVFTSDKKPIVGAIVYFRAENKSNKSNLLSTLTNVNGGWSIDLANLKTADYTKQFVLTDKTIETIVVEAADNGSGKASTTVGKDKPWPDILLKKK